MGSPEASRRWRAANPGKQAKLSRLWREANPDYEKDWRAANPIDPAKHRAKNAKFRKNNPESIRLTTRKYRLKKYGLTQEDYDQLVVRQENRCAICTTDNPRTQSGKWHIDHCHQTNRVRGLLCRKCNVGLGHFNDDSESLEAAIRYLRRTAERMPGEPSPSEP